MTKSTLLAVALLALVVGCNSSKKTNSGGGAANHTTSMLVDGTQVIFDASITTTTQTRVIEAFRFFKSEWSRNGNGPAPRITRLKVRDLTLLAQGNAGYATWAANGSTTEIEVVVFHSNFTNTPIPYFYHEMGHLALREETHTHANWPAWENQQVAANAEWYRSGR